MIEQPWEQDVVRPTGGDLEYDLAHDARDAGGAPASPGARPGGPVVVATDTPDYDGDYSYDLAHDVPR